MAKSREKKFYEKEDFLKLQQEWYAKLKATGWREIEHFDWKNKGEIGNLMNGFSLMDAVRQYTPQQEEYYRLAMQYKTRVTKRLGGTWQAKAWHLHADGASFREIGDKVGVHRRHVSKYIKEEARRMLAWAKEAEEAKYDV